MTRVKMLQKGRVCVYIAIDEPLFHIEDTILSDDGVELLQARTTCRIADIRLVTHSPEAGHVVTGLQFPFARGEGVELVDGWREGLDALRAAWRASLEPRALRVELDDEALGKLGAAVARELHEAAQAEMAAEAEAEVSGAELAAQVARAAAGGAEPPGKGESLAMLAEPLSTDVSGGLSRGVANLQGVARMAYSIGTGEAVGVYVQTHELTTVLMYLGERGYKFVRVIADI